MKICTIDIGKGGGFAYLEKKLTNKYQVQVIKMPDTIVGIDQVIRSIPCDAFALEDVKIRPSDMLDGKIYRIVDVMIKNLHYLEAVLEVNKKPHFRLHPNRWQRQYRPQIKKLEYQDRKRFFKDEATRIFKHTKATLWNADALLMLNYMWGQWSQKSDWLRDKEREINVKLF